MQTHRQTGRQAGHPSIHQSSTAGTVPSKRVALEGKEGPGLQKAPWFVRQVRQTDGQGRHSAGLSELVVGGGRKGT